MTITSLFSTCPNCGNEINFGPSALEKAGTCGSCQATVQLLNDGGAAQRRGTELWEEIEEEKHHTQSLAALEKELKKSREITLLASRVVRIGQPVSLREQDQFRRDSKKAGGAMRTDTVQCVQLQHAGEIFYLLIPHFGDLRLIHEFASVLPGSIPTCLYYERDGAKKHVLGHWLGTNGGESDPIAQMARGASATIKAMEWNNYMAGGTQSALWGLQALPTEGRTLHLMQTAVGGIFSNKFRPKWYLERRAAFVTFATTLPSSTPPAPHMRYQPTARLFIQEILKRAGRT